MEYLYKRRKNEKDLTISQQKEIKETFHILCKDDDKNLLEIENLKTAMMGLALNPSNDEIERIINQLKLFKKMKKEEELKYISYIDFYEIVYYRLVNKSFDADCSRVFNLMSEGKEEITCNDMEKMKEHFYEKSDDVNELIKAADCDKDGKVGFEDFKKLMDHTNYM